MSYGKATPYLPVIDLLKAYFQIEGRDDSRKIRERVTGKLLALDRALEAVLPAFLALLDAASDDPQWQALEPPQRRQRTLDGVKRLLLRESQAQPLVLVFEDLHWVDTETQALLDAVVDSLSTARLLLLVNYRPEYHHGWGHKSYYSQLRVDPLPPESADELLRALLGDHATLGSLKQLLVQRTEGNPFFLEESIQTLIETQVLTGERGAYRLGKDLRTIQLPPSVQAVLAARIDRLPPEEKRLLQSAAVIGKDVPRALLHAIAEVPEEELRRSLASLLAAEFLYETRLFPDLEYTFKHALVQEAAYTSLLKDRRQHYHHKIAQVLEKQFRETVETQPELLAKHYTEAGFNEPAAAYWRRAGRRAYERSTNVEAIRYLLKASELLATLPDTPGRAQQELLLQMALGPALMALKGYAAPDVERAYIRARALCAQVGEPRQLFSVLLGLWNCYFVRAELQMGRELGEQLIPLAQSVQDPVLRVRAHAALGEILFHLEELVLARSHLEQGIALYEPLRHHSRAVQNPGVACIYYTALALWLLGYPDQALQRSQEAFGLAQEQPHSFSLGVALCGAAWLHQFCREAHATQQRAEAAITLSTEQGFSLWVAMGTIFRGWAIAVQGEREDGIRQMRHGMAAWRTTGAELLRPYWLALLAEVHGNLGQAEEGLNALAEGLTVAHKTGERLYEAEIYRLKGELLLRQASADEQRVESYFRQALDIARRQQAKSLELRAALSLSRLWQQQGKRHEARQALSEVYAWFTEGFDTADLQEAKAQLEYLS